MKLLLLSLLLGNCIAKCYNPPNKRYEIDNVMIIDILSIKGSSSKSILEMNTLNTDEYTTISTFDIIKIITESTIKIKSIAIEGTEYLDTLKITHPIYNYDFSHWENRLMSATVQDEDGIITTWWKRILEEWEHEYYSDEGRFLLWRVFRMTVDSVEYYYQVELNAFKLMGN